MHPITCSLGVATRHFDVQFLAVAPAGAEPVRSDESLDLRWFAWDELPPDISPELPRLVAAARGPPGPVSGAARAARRLAGATAAAAVVGRSGRARRARARWTTTSRSRR